MITLKKVVEFKQTDRGRATKVNWCEKGNLIFVHLAGLIDLWIEATYCMNNKETFIPRRDIRKEFTTFPGFVSFGVCKRINGITQKSIVFHKSTMPPYLIKILELSQTVNGGN